jgi:hypothetical protein
VKRVVYLPGACGWPPLKRVEHLPLARGSPPWDRVDQLPRSGGSPPSERIGIRTRLGSNVESELDLLIKNQNVSCMVALEARGSRPLEAHGSPPSDRVDHSREARG